MPRRCRPPATEKLGTSLITATPAGKEGQSGADPRQEGPFVGEGEPVVRFLPDPHQR